MRFISSICSLSEFFNLISCDFRAFTPFYRLLSFFLFPFNSSSLHSYFIFSSPPPPWSGGSRLSPKHRRGEAKYIPKYPPPNIHSIFNGWKCMCSWQAERKITPFNSFSLHSYFISSSPFLPNQHSILPLIGWECMCWWQAERKITATMSEPLERSLSKSLQRGEDPHFDQEHLEQPFFWILSRVKAGSAKTRGFLNPTYFFFWIFFTFFLILPWIHILKMLKINFSSSSRWFTMKNLF